MGDLASPGASAPRDILIDLDTGEFVLSPTGDLQFTSGPQAIVQSITIRLRFILGEWFLDTAVGTPWLTILGRKYNPAAAHAVVRSELLKTPGVAAVTKLALAFDKTTRTLRITWAVSTDYGPLAGTTPVTP